MCDVAKSPEGRGKSIERIGLQIVNEQLLEVLGKALNAEPTDYDLTQIGRYDWNSLSLGDKENIESWAESVVNAFAHYYGFTTEQVIHILGSRKKFIDEHQDEDV